MKEIDNFYAPDHFYPELEPDESIIVFNGEHKNVVCADCEIELSVFEVENWEKYCEGCVYKYF